MVRGGAEAGVVGVWEREVSGGAETPVMGVGEGEVSGGAEARVVGGERPRGSERCAEGPRHGWWVVSVHGGARGEQRGRGTGG